MPPSMIRFGRVAGQRYVAWNQHRSLSSFNPVRRFRHLEDAGGDGGAGSGAGGSGDGAGGGDGSGDGGDGDAGGASGGGGGAGKSFDQTQVNAIVKREKEKMEAKFKEKIQEQLNEVNELKKSKDLTEKQRKTLDERAASLQAELLTEREKAEAEKRRADEKHKTEMDGVSKERDTWQHRFENQTIETAILAAAAKHDAYNAKQVIGLVKDLVNVSPVLDDEGNPTDKFDTSITVKVKEKDEMVEKKFTVDGYVEHMKGQDEYANLFVVKRPGGTGHRQGGVDVGGKSMSHLSSTDKIAAGLKDGQASSGSTG